METEGSRTTMGQTSARPRGRTLTMVVLSVLLALFLAACNGDDGGEPEAETTPTSTASPTEETTAEATGTEGDGGEEGRVAQTGDNVSLHYRGTLDDGTEFDSSAGRDPLQFTVGSGQVIAGFDEAVLGMTVGDKKTFRLEPEQAYGERRDDLVITVPSDNAPEGLEAGQQVALGNAPATVISVEENGDVIVDANHQLAGQALTFDVELVAIE